MDPRRPARIGPQPEKRRTKADAYMSFVTRKESPKQRAQRRDKGPHLFRNAPVALAAGAIDVAASAKAADGRNQIPGRERPPEKGEFYRADVQADAWSQFKVFGPSGMGQRARFLTWGMADGVNKVGGSPGGDGLTGSGPGRRKSGSANLRSSHLQAISLAAQRGRRLRSRDVRDAFLRVDGFERDVINQSPPEWLPGEPRRVRKLDAPSCCLNDTPVAPRWTPKRYLINNADSLEALDLRLEASQFDPFSFFAHRTSGAAAGAMATRIDDLLGCGGREILHEMDHSLSARVGPVKVQKDTFT